MPISEWVNLNILYIFGEKTDFGSWRHILQELFKNKLKLHKKKLLHVFAFAHIHGILGSKSWCDEEKYKSMMKEETEVLKS